MPQSIPSSNDLAVMFEAALRLAIDPTGTGAINLRAGSDNAALVSMATQLGNRVFAYSADRVRARITKSSTDNDLDELVQDLFSDKRKDASAATTTVYLTRPSGATATLINKGTRFGTRQQGTQPALQYQALQDVAAGIGSGSGFTKVAVPVQCLTQGVVGNVLQTAIVDILDSLQDTTWAIFTPATGDVVLGGGNIDVVAGGADVETDAQLIARMNQRSLDTDRQRGTKAAILTGALRVPGVQFVTPVEPGDGTTILYIGDAGYQLSSGMLSAVLTELENWRTFGVPIIGRAYAATLVQVNLRLFMARPVVNYSKPLLQAAAQAAVVSYFTNLPRPDEYYTEAIVAAGFSAHPEVQHAILDNPVASVTRPADAGYGAVTALSRYYANAQSVNVSILDPYHL